MTIFKQELREVDPYRLDNMDTYSNILYVKECKGALSFLAHSAVTSNKYQPQTCCIVGNYYSLKGKHEKVGNLYTRSILTRELIHQPHCSISLHLLLQKKGLID